MHLACVFSAGMPVDDVDARLLQLLRPADVGALVEARLQLHHADRLLAALGGLDQRRHQRRVGARPVDGLLDRQHVRILDRLLDEALHRGGEGVVGVVDEQVARRGSRRTRWPPRPSSPAAAAAGVTGVHGGSRSSPKPGDGRPRPRGPPGRAGRRPRRPRRSSSFERLPQRSRSLALIPASTSRRTTSPKRRRRSSSSTACSRSSASSDTS